MNHRLQNSVVACLLIIIAGCGDSIGDGAVSFEDLRDETAIEIRPATEPPIAMASHQNAIETPLTTDRAVVEVDVPPDNSDPFASDPVEPPESDAPAPDDEPVVTKQQRELSPIERMLQQRAAAIARATGKSVPSTGELFDDTPREIKLLVKDNSFRAEGPDGALRVSFDDLDLLKVLNMVPVPTDAADHFPQWLQDLHGKTVRIRGFMYPTMRETGITKFRMARDNDICCFVKEPKIYDTMRVKMKAGTATDYIMNLPFDVVGTFHINPLAEFGELYELWRIDDAVIINKRR
jgi:hypothetical protein